MNVISVTIVFISEHLYKMTNQLFSLSEQTP